MLNMNIKHAINDRKQAELNALTFGIAQTQYQVAQLQSIVTSLTQKNDDFTALLLDAEKRRDTASSNLNMVNQVIAGIKNILGNTDMVRDVTEQADDKIRQTAEHLSTLIKQLIFSVEIIEKLAQLVNKKKASGKIITNELVKTITAASADANNAVAVTLTALTSCYVAKTSGNEAKNITWLECEQSSELYELITLGKTDNTPESGDADTSASAEKQPSLLALLTIAKEESITKYNAAFTASNSVTQELAQAQTGLNNATVKLNSLKLGLAAATAAAIAA
ncbi:MAG: hypothetical protein NTY50_12580 [Methylobacter sp.]|nr:hypothetical protein [Methylobacter sp.]